MPEQTAAETGATQASCPRCGAEVAADVNFCPRCGNDLRGKTSQSDTYRGFLPGTVIDGRYRLIERLGEGGMGTVFRVEHVRMGKVMALKVLRPDLAVQPAVLERFRSEARIVSRLEHPNTISVFDFGELEGGTLYIAMEFVRGRDLARILASEGRLAERRAALLSIQVLRSLEEAHEAGIVHRDIKPANVMVTQTRGGEDWAKVVDFGIAKLRRAGELERPTKPGEARGDGTITGIAEFVGTPNYCAPEQARGQHMDARSDLYSLGALLYEVVTGKPPFDAPTAMGVVQKHLSDPVPLARAQNPEVSPELESVIARAMAKDPADRFQSAEEMRKAMEAFEGSPSRTFTGPNLPIIDGYEIASREDWDGFERTLRRGQRLRAVSGAALIVAILGGGAAFGYHKLTAAPVDVPLTAEREPNDDPAHANLIALDTAVTGAIGESHVRGKSDLDTYRLDIATPGLLTVSLSGVADLNLTLELFDAEKEARREVSPLAHVLVDDGRLGEGELLANVPVQPGRYFLRVGERPAYDEPDPTRPPRERANAPYTLRAHVAPATELDEIEPNDSWSIAQVVSPSQPLLARAGARLPTNALERDLRLAAFDYFKAALDKPALAFVVQPPDRALGAWDAQRVESWRKQAGDANARRKELELKGRAGDEAAAREAARIIPPAAPAAIRANASGVITVRLTPFENAVGVLAAPLSGSAPTPDDAPYGLAFAHAGPGGLEAVLGLARELEARQRGPAAKALLDAAALELPNSPDLDKLKAARGR